MFIISNFDAQRMPDVIHSIRAQIVLHFTVQSVWLCYHIHTQQKYAPYKFSE